MQGERSKMRVRRDRVDNLGDGWRKREWSDIGSEHERERESNSERARARERAEQSREKAPAAQS